MSPLEAAPRNWTERSYRKILHSSGSIKAALRCVGTSATHFKGARNLRIGLSGSTKVNRKDFGLIWNAPLELGGVLVGEEVTITLDVQFVKG